MTLGERRQPKFKAGAAVVSLAVASVGFLVLRMSIARATVVYDVHVVKPGETLATVAAKYHVIPAEIAKRNGLKPNAPLATGTTLIIQKGSSPDRLDPAEQGPAGGKENPDAEVKGRVVVTRVYTVRPDETLEGIAQRFGVPAERIRECSRLPKDAKASAGQVISIPLREEVLYEETAPPLKQPGTPSRAKELRGATAGDKTESVKKSPSNGKASAAAQPKPRVIGRLGTIAQSGARIRKKPLPDGVTVFHCVPGNQVILVGETGDWYGVLMIDGSTCYVPKKYVKVENMELTSDSSGKNGGNPAIVDTALKYLGIPYHYGGVTVAGMDCSAFLQKVFYTHGFALPRTAQDQFRVGTPVGFDQLSPSDRLYFSKSGTRVDHCGIYIGNGQFIHASGTAGYVTIGYLFEPANWTLYVGARR